MKTRYKYINIFFIILFCISIFFIIKNQSEITQVNEVKEKLHPVGISIGTNIFFISQDELNKQFDDMVLAGINWIRFDIDWSLVQPDSPNTYNFSQIDRVVQTANLKGIKMLPIIDNTPAWARISGCYTIHCPPQDMNDFAKFVSVVIERYSKKGIHNWEIWNEPNLVLFWGKRPNPEEYTKLLAVAYKTIKQIDPSAQVITGGVGPGNTSKGDLKPLDFIDQIYKKGAKDYFDAIGFHPYSFPAPPSYLDTHNTWLQIDETDVSLRSIMSSNGDSLKKVWITEFGVPTGGPGKLATEDNYESNMDADHVTEEFQSFIIRDAFELFQEKDWYGPMFLYSYKDLGTNKNSNENFFGLLRYDGKEKPVYALLKELISISD